MSKEPQIKGIAMRRALENVRRLRGDDAMDQALTTLPSQLADKLRYGGISPNAWYPLSWHVALHDAVRSATRAGLELPRQLGYESAKKNFTTIHRVFVAFSTPEDVIGKAPRMFATYYDTGSMEIVEARRGMARARWSGCVGFSQNLWEVVLGSVTATLELCGAKNVRVHAENGGKDGDDAMEAVAYWT